MVNAVSSLMRIGSATGLDMHSVTIVEYKLSLIQLPVEAVVSITLIASGFKRQEESDGRRLRAQGDITLGNWNQSKTTLLLRRQFSRDSRFLEEEEERTFTLSRV